MVREGRVLISAVGDPDFGSNYYVTAYEVGAVVSAVHDGAGIPVDAGHGFAALDKFIVLSEFPGVTKYGTVTSVNSTKLFCASVSVAIGDVLINLAQDTGVTTPNYNGNGLAVYSDMDYGSQLTNNTVQTDSNGRYRYYYNNLPIWELVRSSLTTPFTAYLDTGLSGVGGTGTDNRIVRWDGTASIQDSVVTIADTTGNMSGVGTLSVGGALTAAAAVTVGTTLGVTGATTVAAVTASGLVTMSGAATVGTTLTVTGNLTASAAASVGTTLGVGTNATVGGTLGVTGDATFTGAIVRSVAAAVTAAATPNNTQAGGTVLTKDVNNVATCATAGNSVVMPAAIAGRMVSVFNNGVASCAVWPAVGDNLGLGVNVQNTLSATSNVTYCAYDTTNWEII